VNVLDNMINFPGVIKQKCRELIHTSGGGLLPLASSNIKPRVKLPLSIMWD